MAARRNRTQARPVAEQGSQEAPPNPVWFKPIMFGFMLLGLVWMLVYYISKAQLPLPTLGNWNIAIGIGIMMVGFLMTTRWR